ncbi:TcmI family type II polyketide cyclase [Saccharomonospora sp.]|uniref:TcmI family type II polyketide cyclase n=1 Tax=Saccharomonospora sp. TaxID=33913 RepID=UPI0026197690|nr:TcmI family type II polyketide cyclase [Saccharomonospora sp.]
MHRTLIVARMNQQDSDAVANVFAESDSTELPHLVGVTRRTLFAFHGLYFHLVESGDDINPNLDKARQGELYADINTKLGAFISPFDPDWKQPKDAMAVPFYSWTPESGHTIHPVRGRHMGENR